MWGSVYFFVSSRFLVELGVLVICDSWSQLPLILLVFLLVGLQIYGSL